MKKGRACGRKEYLFRQTFFFFFDRAGAISQLRKFLCENGARFYGLSMHASDSIMSLERRPWTIPMSFKSATSETVGFEASNMTHTHEIIPLGAGETVQWTLITN